MKKYVSFVRVEHHAAGSVEANQQLDLLERQLRNRPEFRDVTCVTGIEVRRPVVWEIVFRDKDVWERGINGVEEKAT